MEALGARVAAVGAALVLAVIFLFRATSSSAIVGGVPDIDEHSNVGALVAELPGVGRVPVCSATLVSPTVALTAAHCTDALTARGVERVSVSFDSVLDPRGWTLHSGSYVTDPRYGRDMGDLHDLAVILFDVPVEGVVPASLASSALGDLGRGPGDLRTLSVGYGFNDRVVGAGRPQFVFDGARRATVSVLTAITPNWVKVRSRGGEGLGGVCYGDSGGPIFLEGSQKVIAVISRGDAVCAALGDGYRVDTDSAAAFLRPYVPSP